MTADYDSGQFTIAPAIFPADPSTTCLVTVYPPGYTPPSDAATAQSHSSLSAGAIVGIAVGAVGALAFIAGAIFWLWRRRRLGREWAKAGYSNPPSADSDFAKAELDADEAATKRQELEDAERQELGAGEAPELAAEERQELEAGEAGQELDASSDGARHRTGLLLGHAASSMHHKRYQSCLFEMQ